MPDIKSPRPANHSTTDLLQKFLDDNADKAQVRVADLMSAVEGRAYGLALLILALATLIIAHLPGISTIIAVPVVLFAGQMAAGRPNPWLPRRALNHKIKMATLTRVLGTGIKLLDKVEMLIEPRLPRLIDQNAQRTLGVICLVIGLLMALPFPLGNYLPATGLALIALGMLEKDGLFAAIGFVLGVLGSAYDIAFISGLSHLFHDLFR